MLTSKSKISLAAICLFMLFFASFPRVAPAEVIILIQVSPNILNLQNEGQVVTIHADIAYSLVNTSTVLLNGVPVLSTKYDNLGYFVAKFTMEDVKNLPLLIGEYNTLTFTGCTTNGEPFVGTQQILVINNVPKGK